MSPGTGVCIDESMGKWIPFFKDTPEGIPNLTKLIRKPVGVGAEYKCMADAWSGIMLFLEYQEGKDRMQLKKWCDQYPKHVALVLRLTEILAILCTETLISPQCRQSRLCWSMEHIT